MHKLAPRSRLDEAAQESPTRRHWWSPAWAVWRLCRLENVVLAALLVSIGRLMDRQAVGDHLYAWAPAAVAALTLAAGNAHNDLVDLNADSYFKSFRPLPSHQLSLRFTRGVIALLSVGAIGLGLFGPVRFTLFALGILSLSFLYSRWLKRLPLVGNLCMASLVGALVLFPAVWSGAGDHKLMMLFALVTVGMLAIELGKTIEDRLGDDLAQYRTVATRWPEPLQRALLATVLSLYFTLTVFFSLTVTHSLGTVPSLVLPGLPLIPALRRQSPGITRWLKLSKLAWPLAALGLLGCALLQN